MAQNSTAREPRRLFSLSLLPGLLYLMARLLGPLMQIGFITLALRLPYRVITGEMLMANVPQQFTNDDIMPWFGIAIATFLTIQFRRYVHTVFIDRFGYLWFHSGNGVLRVPAYAIDRIAPGGYPDLSTTIRINHQRGTVALFAPVQPFGEFLDRLKALNPKVQFGSGRPA